MSQPTCPKCGASIDSSAGFGMITCSKCNEIVMLDENNNTYSAQSSQPKRVATKEAKKTVAQNTQQTETRPPTVSAPDQTEIAKTKIAITESVRPEMTNLENVKSETAETHSAENQSAARTRKLDDTPFENPPIKPATSDLSDIAEFGNQELPSTAHGALVYDLKIMGIDTQELREKLGDCLRDRRLQLDVTQTLGLVKKGELLIFQINPVKASIIVGRLKHLPFEITWRAQQLIRVLVLTIVTSALVSFGMLKCARAGEWPQHEVNLKAYTIKIHNGQEEIEKLIREKNANRDPDKREALLKEIVEKHQALRKLYEDMHQEEEHVRFEHPEQGEKAERLYKHLKVKTIEELENDQSLDGQLMRTKQKVDQVYPKGGSLTAKKATSSPTPSPVSSPVSSPAKSQH